MLLFCSVYLNSMDSGSKKAHISRRKYAGDGRGKALVWRWGGSRVTAREWRSDGEAGCARRGSGLGGDGSWGSCVEY